MRGRSYVRRQKTATIRRNAIGIVFLSLVAIHGDHGFMEGRLHHEGDIVFFVMALVALGALLLFVCKSESRRSVEVRTA